MFFSTKLKIYEWCSNNIAFYFYFMKHGWFTSKQVSAEMCKLIICSLGLLAKHNSIVFFGQIVCLMSHSWRSFDCTRSRLTGLPLLAPHMDAVLNLSENISPKKRIFPIKHKFPAMRCWMRKYIYLFSRDGKWFVRLTWNALAKLTCPAVWHLVF